MDDKSSMSSSHHWGTPLPANFPARREREMNDCDDDDERIM